MKTSFEIRKSFLDYFQQKGHTPVESSGLVPAKDPTLLFTNAGMVQFKNVFLGEEKRDYHRATSSQKCVRAGGKHNDLENVGRTARHHTFFEMLGNFSFGDYFKAEAIEMAWEYLTGVLALSPARLWVTVYEEDDEALQLWEKIPGVLPGRVVRLGKKDNFWSMGDTGPCGPCSEILIDQGEQFSCGSPDCKVGCDCDRYLELWNLVFMQFDRDESGAMSPLPKPSIDTGMGLERVTAVLQGVPNNYETDLFKPLLDFVAAVSGKAYGAASGQDTSMKVVADHSRAVSFLVADGVMPSNEGRGYVLRRIMRRAARHGKLLGIDKPFLHRAVGVVAEQMRAVYPEVQRSLDYIEKVVLNEEKAFAVTLEAGLKILEEEIEQLCASSQSILPGAVAFKLYDTYGFPIDLTADIVGEKGITIDQEGFEQAMQDQRTRARQAWKGSGEDRVAAVFQQAVQEGLKTVFSGYEKVEGRARIERIVIDGASVAAARQGDAVEIIVDTTPFYGESGGQIGDHGIIEGDGFRVRIDKALKPVAELIVHRGTVEKGEVPVGSEVVLTVDNEKRRAITGNHTATHILHAVLRERLGNHVKQAGSLVAPERLRFDFSHFESLSRDDLRVIEGDVNACIRRNRPVAVQELSRQEALERGATALFGEKYGETVRVVSLDDFSMELCGGTHVHATGEIGFLKIVSESAVAAGVRRIEALTGLEACRYVENQAETVGQLGVLLKTDQAGLVDKVQRLLSSHKELEKERDKIKSQMAAKNAGSVLDGVREIGGVKVLAVTVDGQDPKALRAYGDQIRDRIGSGIMVFGVEAGGKAHLLVMVTKDLTKRFSAGNIVKEIAPVVGGRGGGRPDMAQAGGPEGEKLDAALAKALEVIEQMAS
ncbi:MAG: alanine--tRNA ligase [Deltaproteobacteria bacterium]|nr:alanine--tRNA ligase [Deltaproteobacteria bacterium]